MKATLTLGDNSFEYEGEDPLPLFRLWLNAQQPGADAVKLEELTTRLRGNSDALAAVVAQFEGDINGA
jgi:hypothetical protein